MKIQQRTQATIHLDRLARNIRNVQNRLRPDTEIMAVVKADGYGHGSAGILPMLQQCGIHRFAVAMWEEGAVLRAAGAEEDPILVLGDTWDSQLEKLIDYRLTGTIFAKETARKLNDLAAARGVVQPIHIKLDTGMRRIGFGTDEAALDAIVRIAALPNLSITGAFTHFARADELDRSETNDQYTRFMTAIGELRRRGVEIPFPHVANSASILLRPEVHLQGVRAGDILYGLCPIDEDLWPEMGLQEVLTWETYVTLVKTVPAGVQIGYGGTYTTRRPTVIATIPVGYADGYNRALSNRGCVVIRGTEAPIIGRVCMDQFMVDVTHIPSVQRGDEVELIGSHISVGRMAEMAGITPDEVVCGLTQRVPRVYTAE